MVGLRRQTSFELSIRLKGVVTLYTLLFDHRSVPCLDSRIWDVDILSTDQVGLSGQVAVHFVLVRTYRFEACAVERCDGFAGLTEGVG